MTTTNNLLELTIAKIKKTTDRKELNNIKTRVLATAELTDGWNDEETATILWEIAQQKHSYSSIVQLREKYQRLKDDYNALKMTMEEGIKCFKQFATEDKGQTGSLEQWFEGRRDGYKEAADSFQERLDSLKE